jgi:hypothetical protein
MDQIEGEAKLTLVGVGQHAVIPSTAYGGNVAPQLGEHLEGIADNVRVTLGHGLLHVFCGFGRDDARRQPPRLSRRPVEWADMKLLDGGFPADARGGLGDGIEAIVVDAGEVRPSACSQDKQIAAGIIAALLGLGVMVHADIEQQFSRGFVGQVSAVNFAGADVENAVGQWSVLVLCGRGRGDFHDGRQQPAAACGGRRQRP